jgi:hypothetical protein
LPELAHRYRVSGAVPPSQRALLELAGELSLGAEQNTAASGPPSSTGVPGMCPPSPSGVRPEISNPGVLGDAEYAVVDPPWSVTPVCRVMVMVLGAEV